MTDQKENPSPEMEVTELILARIYRFCQLGHKIYVLQCIRTWYVHRNAHLRFFKTLTSLPVVNTASGGGSRGGAVNKKQCVTKICFERMS